MSSHSRQWLLGPLDIQLWRLESRLASLWICRACLVMLQACSDSEDRCQSQTPPGHLPVSAEVSVTLQLLQGLSQLMLSIGPYTMARKPAFPCIGYVCHAKQALAAQT